MTQEAQKPQLNMPVVGSRISINDLKVNDLFWMDYGLDKVKFRVHKIFEGEGIFAHSVKWCKSSSIVIKYDTKRNIHYAGKMSKFRSWLML